MLAFAASIAALAASIDAVATKHARSTALALAASTEAAALRHACFVAVIVEGVVIERGGGDYGMGVVTTRRGTTCSASGVVMEGVVVEGVAMEGLVMEGVMMVVMMQGGGVSDFETQTCSAAISSESAACGGGLCRPLRLCESRPR